MVNALGVPPAQMVCVAVGWVVIVGSATAITAAVFEVAVPHADPDKVMMQ
jgi:hypothetical protein